MFRHRNSLDILLGLVHKIYSLEETSNIRDDIVFIEKLSISKSTMDIRRKRKLKIKSFVAVSRRGSCNHTRGVRSVHVAMHDASVGVKVSDRHCGEVAPGVH